MQGQAVIVPRAHVHDVAVSLESGWRVPVPASHAQLTGGVAAEGVDVPAVGDGQAVHGTRCDRRHGGRRLLREDGLYRKRSCGGAAVTQFAIAVEAPALDIAVTDGEAVPEACCDRGHHCQRSFLLKDDLRWLGAACGRAVPELAEGVVASGIDTVIGDGQTVQPAA